MVKKTQYPLVLYVQPDSNGNNFHKGESNMSSMFRNQPPQFWVGAIVSIIGATALAINAMRVDPNKHDLANVQIAQAISQQKIAEATGAVPAGYTFPAAPTTTPATNSHTYAKAEVGQKVVIHSTKDFSCNTETDRQKGFAAGNVQYVDASSQALRVNSKCLLVNLSGTVSGLEAKGYRFSVPDPAIPGNYYKCGDLGDNTDSVDACIAFANRWSGKNMRVSVIEGGYVNFN